MLGRTAFWIAVLLVVTQLLWVALIKFLFIKPAKFKYIEQLADVITMAQLYIRNQPSSDHKLAENLSLGELKIFSDNIPRPPLVDEGGELWDSYIKSRFQNKFGPSVLVRREANNKSSIWVRFSVDGRLYWIMVSRTDLEVIPYSLMIWGGFCVCGSVVGAYLIIFSVTQRLRTLRQAVVAVGRGETPPLLEETGPDEVRDLSRGFNQMAEDLKRMDSERRIMLAGISHDLRTPLTHLRISVELLNSAAEQGIMAGMVHDIEDMDSILKQFLDYARDGSEEEPQVSDFNHVVGDVCHRYTVRGSDIKVTLGTVPDFSFRRLALRRVVTNLVDNAVRYGNRDIEVVTRFEKPKVVLTVMDRGPGIRRGDPQDFIKPFAREDISRGSQSGAGLGLTIADRVTRMHGGELCLTNRAQGGLSVTVAIPAL